MGGLRSVWAATDENTSAALGPILNLMSVLCISLEIMNGRDSLDAAGCKNTWACAHARCEHLGKSFQ